MMLCFKPLRILEDNQQAAIEELQRREVNSNDVVIGIAASGRTPFTVAALQYAKADQCINALNYYPR